jgi:hypothetical protein
MERIELRLFEDTVIYLPIEIMLLSMNNLHKNVLYGENQKKHHRS